VEGSARGLKEKRERSQSVPLTLPASYSLFLRNILRTKIRQTLKFERHFPIKIVFFNLYITFYTDFTHEGAGAQILALIFFLVHCPFKLIDSITFQPFQKIILPTTTPQLVATN